MVDGFSSVLNLSSDGNVALGSPQSCTVLLEGISVMLSNRLKELIKQLSLSFLILKLDAK